MTTEKTKVKSYIRDGKLVKSHNRLYKKKPKRNYTRDLVVSNAGFFAATAFGLTRKNKIFRNTIMTASLLGLPVSNFLILKARYEDNLKQSAKNIKEGKDVPNMRVTGLTPKPKKTDKPQLTFFFAGLSDKHSEVVEGYRLVRKSFKDEGFLNKSELIGVTQEQTNRGKFKAITSVAGGNLVKGKNPDSEKIAKYIHEWKKKNPDAKINLIGHSGGGLTSKDVAYILHQTGIKKSDIRNLTIGTPYLDIVPSKTPTRNIIVKEDIFNKSIPIKNKTLQEIDLVAPINKTGVHHYQEQHQISTYLNRKIKQSEKKYKENPVYNEVVNNLKEFFNL